ncbi:hypothetical protein HKBW3S03_00995 [Candidatus Hakubella thermalkaliphila]|uniref:Uncharacterized protein n=1 Tax=Candidatus Hakubella thermalkaliphila TaxID=2754717 RepID=A0A6V8Q6D7_9ACTN|nr:hypothetical protein HKBW3S03_00995 [Candidatus Hakubella thermalkaliphila]GFP37377.1 hypothetical protein HKBW3S44_01057 [Candidatus Hakubella thermalkaliphila]GFP40298.1 hypothetical protein HKBW3S47_01994 [Candidatus Hakubella thermalkaliphila]
MGIVENVSQNLLLVQHVKARGRLIKGMYGPGILIGHVLTAKEVDGFAQSMAMIGGKLTC